MPVAEEGIKKIIIGHEHPAISITVIALVSIAVSIAIALLTERIAYKPLRFSPRLMPLITALGASFFWQYYFRGLFGSQIKPFPRFAALEGTVPFLNTVGLKSHVVVIAVTILMLIALNSFFSSTKTGTA